VIWIIVAVVMLCYMQQMAPEAAAEAAAVMGTGSGVKPPSGMYPCLDKVFMYSGIFSLAALNVMIATSSQAKLTVPQRNSMIAADAFLTPVKEIFQFLEDTVTVKITYAMAQNDSEAVNAVLIVGVVGGAIMGAIAALGTTALAYWPAAIAVLLAPGADRHQTDFPGCGLVPSAETMVLEARSYWVLRSWTWPFAFIALVLTGLILGSKELGLWGVALIASQATLGVIWFFGPKVGLPLDLSLLGWAYFLSAVVFVGALSLCVVCNRNLVRQYRLRLCPQRPTLGGSSIIQVAGASVRRAHDVGKDAIKHGLIAMVLDLCVQLCITIGIYAAGELGLPQLYQLSAMQAAMPTYGTSWALGVGYAIRLVGAGLVGGQQYFAFGMFVHSMTACGLAFAVLTVGTVIPWRRAVAFGYGSQACQFASDTNCLPIYAGMFGEGDSITNTLQASFGVFAPAAGSYSLFMITKAGLYACFDFAFMAWWSVAALFVVFLPGILVASQVYKTAAALYVAMYLPMLFLAIVFYIKLLVNLRRMNAGQPGPWKERARAMTAPNVPPFGARNQTWSNVGVSQPPREYSSMQPDGSTALLATELSSARI